MPGQYCFLFSTRFYTPRLGRSAHQAIVEVVQFLKIVEGLVDLEARHEVDPFLPAITDFSQHEPVVAFHLHGRVDRDWAVKDQLEAMSGKFNGLSGTTRLFGA